MCGVHINHSAKAYVGSIPTLLAGRDEARKWLIVTERSYKA